MRTRAKFAHRLNFTLAFSSRVLGAKRKTIPRAVLYFEDKAVIRLYQGLYSFPFWLEMRCYVTSYVICCVNLARTGASPH